MTRRPFTILSALSLLLLVALVVLWVMSYARQPRLNFPSQGGMRMHVIELREGVIQYALWRRISSPQGPSAYVHGWNMPVPLGIPVALLLFITAVLIRRQRRLRQRERAGLCPSCGYDLRATPGRCPECGRVSAAPAPSP